MHNMNEEKNVFMDLGERVRMPEAAKAQVMDKIAAAKLVLDFWDLFAPKRIAVNLNVINQSERNQQEKIKNN